LDRKGLVLDFIQFAISVKIYNFFGERMDTFGETIVMLGKYDLMAFVSTEGSAKAKARAFYEEKLGLDILAVDDFGVMYDVNGRRLRMSYVQELKPAPYSVLCWVVPDIRAAIAALVLKEVVFEQYEGFGQDAAGVWTAPDGTLVAWFKDPGGNVLSLAQFS
jgi:hypothetical protein